MDSWEALVIQWVNCLHENSNDYVRNIEELKDGRIYWNLINKLKSWSCKEYSDCQRDMVFEFLNEEYPNFACNSTSDIVDNLCVGLLVLSRLSLEPVFHKSLCVNLSYDLQIKIKSILETIYALGKNVTADELCKTFSLSDKTDFKSLSTRSKRILEEFLNSPVVKSVQSEKKMYEQTRHIRHLRADIETLCYEKSELIEDIKVQKKQIDELQNKLQDTLSELKLLRANNVDPDNYDSTQEQRDVKSIELSYKNELKSLEKYVAELQNDNCKLQDEKNDLIGEVKLCKAKCRTVEEKNTNNDQIIESMLFQIEKKDDELTELKMRYEELRNYIKEKSVQLSNQSFEFDDRMVCETSFNKSEALSSVIEIQLQDTKKDLVEMQNAFKDVNSVCTVLIEEYVKLKKKYDILFTLKAEVKHVEPSKCEKCDLREKEEAQKIVRDIHNIVPVELQKELKCEKCDLREKEAQKAVSDIDNIEQLEPQDDMEEQYVVAKLESYKKIVKNEIKLSFADILKDNLSNRNNSTFVMELVNQSDKYKGIKTLKNNISFALHKNTNEDLFAYKDTFYNSNNLTENSEDLEKSKTLQVYKENKNINFIDNNSIIVKFCKMLCQENWNSQLSDFVQILNRFIQTEAGVMAEENHVLSKVLDYKELVETNDRDTQTEMNVQRYSKDTQTEINVQRYSKDTQTDEECNRLLSFYKNNLEYLQSIWVSLRESAFHTFKIYKVLLLLDKNWNLVLESSEDVIDKSKAQPEYKELLEKKAIIEKELKNAHWKNLETLSLNLINSVQFVTLLNNTNDCLPANNENLEDWFSNQLSCFNLKNCEKLKKEHQTYIASKIINIKRRIDNYQYLTRLIEKKRAQSSAEPIVLEDKEKQKSADKKLIKEEDISQSKQFQNYVKDIHEKYELKLEKMKEKMKSVYNNQISAMKKEQEILAMSKLEALQSKFEQQCFNHTEDLKMYKKHISDLSTQLWDVGEKLIIERQRKEEAVQELKKMKSKSDTIESQHPKSLKYDQENFDESMAKPEKAVNALQSIENTSVHKMQSVRGFQIMGNAFKTEDEEGEVFDTTYLADMQRSRNSISSADLNRLSILQMRNSKCKPHLKSSYPGELQIAPIPFSEDEIKTGSTSEEVFNDSLSQSLLTGKKVKRSNRTRTGTETPRRSRRFSNIFRKPRLSMDRK
ncbi:uncharacterized protein PFB0765w [Nasonia vitripennis]|uniref:Uncharacterized protein n=1 Tax=Nasonia vitripennis TaxID=7425 RepID=A0A7M7QHP4_NASVI|nr:uncharacterized protein PFB0765w [Nasonia vitripennis]XP_031786713.1 uncharacterized protein PFB0765w [Nasonia vitripennis]